MFCKCSFNRTALLVYIKCVPLSFTVSRSFSRELSSCSRLADIFNREPHISRFFVGNLFLWLTIFFDLFTDFVAFV